MTANHTPMTPTRGLAPVITRHAYLLAVLVLLGSLAAVIVYARSAGQRENDLAQTRFVTQANVVAANLRQKLLIYELSTRGGVSLFATVDRPTRRQWRNYVDGLDLTHRFPAMMGLGFAELLTPGQLQALQIEIHDSGGGLFSIRPTGIRRQYGPILYLEPATMSNRSAIGYDMLSESARAEAMFSARDTGDTRMTGGVQLVQDELLQDALAQAADRKNALGVLVYSPVYRSDSVPGTRGARRDALSGWVYTLFRMRVFVQQALGELPAGLSLRIVDVTGSDTRLLYPTSDDDPAFAPAGDALRHSVTEDLYGRKWRLDFASIPVATDSAWGLSGLQLTLAIGVVVSLLLFAVAMTLARTQSRARDIALKMSESYRLSELRFRNAMHYSAVGQALLDNQGTIIEANRALADILRSSPEDLAGTAFDAHFDDGKDRISEGGVLQVDDSGVYQSTRRLRRSDGQLRQVRVTLTPIPGETGREVDGLVQVDDVTDRLRAEAQINALNRTLEARVALRTRELTRANDELQSFSYSVSHDLSAPLRSIDGFTKLLSERHGGRLDEAGQGYLNRVRAATVRMSELIEALLKMSRLSRGELDEAALDLSAMAADLIAELQGGEPDRTVEFVIEPGLAATGDPGLIRNLLGNLLANAWKFTRGEPQPRIEFASAEGNAEAGMRAFLVRDNGAGFEPEFVNKLFRPFQRLHSQADFEGHGIGLASVKRIVERHGGDISAQGQPGQGASFRFTLPA